MVVYELLLTTKFQPVVVRTEKRPEVDEVSGRPCEPLASGANPRRVCGSHLNDRCQYTTKRLAVL